MSKLENPSLSPEIVAACKRLVGVSMSRHTERDPKQDPRDKRTFRSIAIPDTIAAAFPDNLSPSKTDATIKAAVLIALMGLRRTSIQVLEGEYIFEYRIPGPIATYHPARIRDAIQAYGEEAVRDALGSDLFNKIMRKTDEGVIDGTFTEVRSAIGLLTDGRN